MKMQAERIVIDLETLAAKAGNPVILQIGAVAQAADGSIVDEFNAYVKPGGADGVIEFDTVRFWMLQDTKAITQLLGGIEARGRALASTLNSFSVFYRQFRTSALEKPPVYGYGSLSDTLWLKSAYRAVGHLAPWDADGRGYRREMCLRTLISAAEAKIGDHFEWPEQPEIAHDALCDAKSQAAALHKALQILGASA